MGSVIDPLLGSHQAGGAHHDESNYQSDDRDPCDWRKDFRDILGKQIGDDRIDIKLFSNPASHAHNQTSSDHSFELAHSAQNDHHKGFHNKILAHAGNHVAIHSPQNATGHPG